jgi:transposase, IS5 family
MMERNHEFPRHPYPEVHPMIAQTFEDVFSPQWVKTHMIDSTHDLVILRHIIPWQSMIDRLVPFYAPQKGRTGYSLRTLVGVSMVARLRQLSDRKVITAIQENRYLQYFCNVPDQGLLTFLNPSTLCRFRQRLGQEGIGVIEEQVFQHLKRASAIQADMMLMDSSVLESPIIYPNDVRLLYKAFGKLGQFAKQQRLPLWWDLDQLKSRWRAFNLSQAQERLSYLSEFYALFVPALDAFRTYATVLAMSDTQRQRAGTLWSVLTLLETQTQQKLAGQRHIDNRLVSLDDLDARPIKRGKTHPSTEFGTTLQMTFNRQGFMITAENFIGHPNDKTLYGPTLEAFRKRMQGYPDTAVTDLGFRSAKNLKLHRKDIDQLFMGQSTDVEAAHQDACRKARSATEGFIAVAKHLRGFGRSMYRGLTGAGIWTRLTQCAYNLQKFLQLYRNEALEERTLGKLRL